MTELSAGVRALIGRMESNPEEFFDDAHKWRFMFGEKFREVMTEPEKGALHEALKQVRRKEFDQKVMRELLKDEMEEQIKGGYYTTQQIGNGTLVGNGGFLANERMGIDSRIVSNGNLGVSGTTTTAGLQIGKQMLTEKDVERIKGAETSLKGFK